MANIAQDQARKAHIMVNNAVRTGELIRGKQCQVCGIDNANEPMMGHHWEGYHKPLSVWWVCRRCNIKLRYRHNGSLTLEDARRFIGNNEPIPDVQNNEREPGPEYFKVTEAARLLGITDASMRGWVKNGYMPGAVKQNPYAKTGSCWLIPLEDILSIIEERLNPARFDKAR